MNVRLWWLLAVPVMAQTNFEEQSARLQNVNAYLLDMRPSATPSPTLNQGWTIGVDITPRPDIDNRIGRKDENIDDPEVVPRLRFRYGHDSGFFAGATYTPGLEYEGYEADYWGAELGYRQSLGRVDIAFRIAYLDGDLLGPITENDIDDFFIFKNSSADVSLGGRIWRRLDLYGFAGYGDIETTLEVRRDGAVLANEDDTYYGGLGLAWTQESWRLVLEQNATDDYLRHVVLHVGYRF